jgi:hypothetical protein
MQTSQQQPPLVVVILAALGWLSLSVRADYLLSIELNKFNNQFGTMLDGERASSIVKCPREKCLTYFKFCLMTTADGPASDTVCLSKFVTQIIGENVIDEEQFELTTNSIEFRVNRELVNGEEQDYGSGDSKVFLLIQALNYDETEDEGQNVGASKSANLISEWKLPIRLVKLNQWIRYEHSVNFKLKQIFIFNYMLNCADDYYGAKCDIRKSTTFFSFGPIRGWVIF